MRHRARIAPGARDEHAQQRRDSRGHLLSAWLAQGQALSRRPRASLRFLRSAFRTVSAVRQAARRCTRERHRRARHAARSRHRKWSRFSRDGRRGLRPAKRTARARSRRDLVARYWHHRSRSPHLRARPPLPRQRCGHARRHGCRRRRSFAGRYGARDAARALSRSHSRERRGPLRRRCLGDAGRKAVSHQTVPGGIRRAGSLEARLGERPCVSASTCGRFGPRRAPDPHDVGQRPDRADRDDFRIRRTTTKDPACRSMRFSSPRAPCCRALRSPICSPAERVSGRNCTVQAKDSQTF